MNKFTLGPGEYFIGDIAYALRTKDIGGWILYRECGLLSIESSEFVVFNTLDNIGSFVGTDGFAYHIIESNFGLVPKALWDWDMPKTELSKCGRVVDVKRSIIFEYVYPGIFLVTIDDSESICVNTVVEYTDDDEYSSELDNFGRD